MAKKIKLHAIQNEIPGNFDHINEDIDRMSKVEEKKSWVSPDKKTPTSKIMTEIEHEKIK